MSFSAARTACRTGSWIRCRPVLKVTIPKPPVRQAGAQEGLLRQVLSIVTRAGDPITIRRDALVLASNLSQLTLVITTTMSTSGVLRRS